MIYNFTGDTKGKTSTALGTIIRALGYQQSVRIVFFMKHWKTSETDFFDQLPETFNLKYYKAGDKDFIYVSEDFNHTTFDEAKDSLLFGSISKRDLTDIEKAQKGLAKAFKYLEDKPFLLVLDELNCAIDFNLLKIEDIKPLIEKAKEQGTHIVITGRGLQQEIARESDLVTEMVKVKHPFDTGIHAVKGLDY